MGSPRRLDQKYRKEKEMTESIIGTQYFQTTLTGAQSTVVFTASSNTNGATIRTISCDAYNSYESFILANYPDGTNRIIFVINAGTNQYAFGNTQNSLRLPSGVGLTVTSALGGNGSTAITYDIY